MKSSENFAPKFPETYLSEKNYDNTKSLIDLVYKTVIFQQILKKTLLDQHLASEYACFEIMTSVAFDFNVNTLNTLYFMRNIDQGYVS